MQAKNQTQQLNQHLQQLQLQNKQNPHTSSEQNSQKMIASRLNNILAKIQSVRNANKIVYPVRLVAASKTKTVQQIKEAYDAGQRHFGQNYVDQIQEKHNKLPNDICWHFIGHLQSNKIKKVVVPNLYVIETVDRQSLAEKIQKHLAKQDPQRILNVLIQVKTSDQQSKNGCELSDIDKLYDYLAKQCPNLKFQGLMTIGKQGEMGVFETMFELKQKMCQKYKLKQQQFQLSMGMSGDFQVAIKNHSTSVRVGSSIFGARNYPNKPIIEQAKV